MTHQLTPSKSTGKHTVHLLIPLLQRRCTADVEVLLTKLLHTTDGRWKTALRTIDGRSHALTSVRAPPKICWANPRGDTRNHGRTMELHIQTGCKARYSKVTGFHQHTTKHNALWSLWLPGKQNRARDLSKCEKIAVSSLWLEAAARSL